MSVSAFVDPAAVPLPTLLAVIRDDLHGVGLGAYSMLVGNERARWPEQLRQLGLAVDAARSAVLHVAERLPQAERSPLTGRAQELDVVRRNVRGAIVIVERSARAA